MASSRIFVRGLPTSYTEDEFRNHFSKHYTVTDSRLLSQRRIGYVGFKTPQDASSAVKYFNKSFIRMSKISVELAHDASQTIGLEPPCSRELLLLTIFFANFLGSAEISEQQLSIKPTPKKSSTRSRR